MMANVYDITIKDPIVYAWDGIDIYQNYDKTGSRGVEFNFQYRPSWGNLKLSYAHYMQADKNKVGAYSVPEKFDNEALLGMSRDKFTFYSSFKFGDNITLSPWLVYNGKKYGWSPGRDNEGNIEWDPNTEFDPTILANIALTYNNLFIEDLALSLSAYNLLNEEINYVQPYMQLWHSPLPGASREFMVKLSYNLFN